MPDRRQPANQAPAEGSRKVIDDELARRRKPGEGKQPTDGSDSAADERADKRPG